MKLKKCPKCGWEYPAEWPGRSCKFCKTSLPMGLCIRCGEWSDTLRNGHKWCPKCSNEMAVKWSRSHVDTAADQLKQWTKLLSLQPMRTLTEKDWLAACEHFGGCAVCGADTIDSRYMFIRFKDGGRYTPWNIIPACEKCATRQLQDTNPFSRMNEVYHRETAGGAKNYGMTLERLNKITDYLRTKMEVQDEQQT